MSKELSLIERIFNLVKKGYNYPVITHGKSNYIKIPVKYVEKGLIDPGEDATIMWVNKVEAKDLIENTPLFDKGIMIVVPDKRRVEMIRPNA